MKLRNKKTGEIKDAYEVLDMKQEDGVLYKYYSLAELCEEWEDYKEPKEYWFVSEFGKVYSLKHIPMDKERIRWLKEIGNYFGTKEEAEQAVEKLKAWKRLKDIGFKFYAYKIEYKANALLRLPSEAYFDMKISDDELTNKQIKEDLDLFFVEEA